MTPVAYDAPAADVAAIADLAGVLAHRLRSLVAGIQASAELLADTVYTPADRALVLQILDGAASIERLLADLLRYGHDTPALVVQPVDLHELLAGTLDALGPEAGRVRLAAAPPPVPIQADPVLLRQAMLALLCNALEATANMPEAPVTVGVTLKGEGVSITVENEGGSGVQPPERLFEPFVTTKAQNLGLGLPLARRIARLHGGDVTLESGEVGPQIRFALILPFTPSDTGAASSP